MSSAIATLRPGDDVDAVFACTRKDRLMTKTGSPYLALEHTVAVATLAHELCQLKPRLNSDLLLTAALVHDIGRIREFTYGADFGLTAEGQLLGHVVMGVQLLSSRAGELDEERRLALLHCVLCHHGPSLAPGGKFGSAEAAALYRLNAL